MLYEYEQQGLGKYARLDPDLQGIFFCAKALSKDRNDPRPHVHLLYVDGPNILGTDGARIHAYHLDIRIPNGWYKVLVCKKTHIAIYHDKKIKAEYPKWRKVLQLRKKIKEKLPVWINPSQDLDRTIFIINTEFGEAVNINFVKDLNHGFDMHHDENKNLIYFENDEKKLRAAIMAKSKLNE